MPMDRAVTFSSKPWFMTAPDCPAGCVPALLKACAKGSALRFIVRNVRSLETRRKSGWLIAHVDAILNHPT